MLGKAAVAYLQHPDVQTSGLESGMLCDASYIWDLAPFKIGVE